MPLAGEKVGTPGQVALGPVDVRERWCGGTVALVTTTVAEVLVAERPPGS